MPGFPAIVETCPIDNTSLCHFFSIQFIEKATITRQDEFCVRLGQQNLEIDRLLAIRVSFFTLEKSHFIVKARRMLDRKIKESLFSNVGGQGLGIRHAHPLIMLSDILGLLTGNNIAKLVDLLLQAT